MSNRDSVGLPGWMFSSACKGTDPELFFPDVRGIAPAQRTERAKAVCACCPVRRECLAYALATRQKWGVWGGASEEERRTMTRRNHKIPSHGRQARPTLRHAHVTGGG